MVEIERIEQSKLGKRDLEKKAEANDISGEGLRLEEQAINHSLVREARSLLEERCNINRDEYSKLHYEEIMDKQCPFTCWRYLVYRELSVESAVELMLASLKWRKENRGDECLNGELAKEFWFHSPTAWTGTTKSGKEDVFYVLGRNYKKPAAILRPTVKKFWANILLEWDRRNRYNLRQSVFVFDCDETGLSNVDIEFTRWVVSVKDFLPARISAVYLVGIPYILRPVVQLIISWLPQSFRKILKCGSFEELITENIGLESLPPEVGGTALSAYLAPLDAPWMSDLIEFSSEEAQKAIIETLWFNVTDERKDQMLSQQLEYEAKNARNH